MNIAEEVTFDKDGHIERFPVLRKFYLAFMIILVALLAFGLGRLTGGEDRGVSIEFDPELSNLSQNHSSNTTQSATVLNAIKPAPSNAAKAGEVVASSKGSKYHYPHCSGAKQISEANRLTFPSSEAAEASGYTLAANCKPR